MFYYSMDKKFGASVVVLVLVFFSFSIANANVNGNSVNDEDQSKKSALWVWQRLRSAYSMYSSVFSPRQYLHMVKAIVGHTYAYFFPPNIDFRRGDQGQAVANNNGAGEIVKEALAKSLGTSKTTLEDVAKSAAEKVKRSLSDHDHDDDDDREKKRPKEL